MASSYAARYEKVLINKRLYFMRDCATTPLARTYAQRLTKAGRTVIRSHHMVYWLVRPEE